MDPVTGANTQKVECLWGHAKTRLLRNNHGTTLELLPSHLDLISFTYEFKNSGVFEKFMEIVRRNYSE